MWGYSTLFVLVMKYELNMPIEGDEAVQRPGVQPASIPPIAQPGRRRGSDHPARRCGGGQSLYESRCPHVRTLFYSVIIITVKTSHVALPGRPGAILGASGPASITHAASIKAKRHCLVQFDRNRHLGQFYFLWLLILGYLEDNVSSNRFLW